MASPTPQLVEKLKIIIIGNKCVGKTSLAHRFVHNAFLAKHNPTILADFFKIELPLQAILPNEFPSRPLPPLQPQSLPPVPPAPDQTRFGSLDPPSIFRNLELDGPLIPSRIDPSTRPASSPVDDRRVLVYLWDTAGQESHHEHDAIISAYYRNADAALMVFKLTEYESFLALQRWRSRLLSKIGMDTRNTERWPIVVLGNFLDMADTQRQVPTAQARRWCQVHGEMPYFEVSSLSGERVHDAFTTTVRLALEHRRRLGLAPDYLLPHAPAPAPAPAASGCAC